MSQEMLDQLRSMDPAMLTTVLRQEQGNPAFELLDWSVEPLGHEKIIRTTGGLYHFSGHGQDGDGIRPWSVVLKIVNHPSGEMCQAPREWCYWKRELLAFDSGLLAGLPGPVRAPRCYGVTEQEDGGWLWMEHIVESTGRRWSPADFGRAAYHLGRSAAAYLNERALPDAPWLGEPFFRSTFADGGWWARHMATDTPESVWQHPLVQQAFAPDLRRRILAIWADKYGFFDALDRLPQVLCHNDCHRRNLMWRKADEGQEELIVLDWAFCGLGGVGMDMGELVATSAYFFEYELSAIEEVERLVFQNYLAGLRAAGWMGDERLVRLGYTASAALWMGATLPGWTAIMLDPASGVNVTAMYGRPAEDVLAGWVALTEFLLDRADEARLLMGAMEIA
ncbi:MAG: phosphotransferase [Caldilineaceae bacterium]|nr:phosphotransferase [Caldilineaceae bacterium]HRJ45221.1 aminoglycoside phosphotransferase family protein [Caldilineaceae bacterium]